MPQQRDTKPTRQQRELAAWFNGVVEGFERQGWSRVKIADRSGLSRKDFYRWLDPEQIPRSPRSETVRRICGGLGLDYRVPARIMGWSAPELSPAPASPETPLDRQIRLIRARLDQKPSTEERRRLERLYVRAKRQRDEQQQMDEELAELLGGEPDPSHSNE